MTRHTEGLTSRFNINISEWFATKTAAVHPSFSLRILKQHDYVHTVTRHLIETKVGGVLHFASDQFVPCRFVSFCAPMRFVFRRHTSFRYVRNLLHFLKIPFGRLTALQITCFNGAESSLLLRNSSENTTRK